MKRYLYLSLTPEALIASMLPPEKFGNYLAIGTKKRTRGQALFFEVDMESMSSSLPVDYIEKRCVPQEGGRPKSSVYLSIYRTLETVPLDSLMGLYLTTDDGRVLKLEKETYKQQEEESGNLHLYQELAPVTPRIASSLSPGKFINLMTDESQQINVPKLAFVELQLGELADDPVSGTIENLPYPNIPHLRDCLLILQNEPNKNVKTVIRFYNGELLYRTCKNGFYVGDKEKLFYYPFPDRDLLESKYYVWWRSAMQTGFR